MNISYNWLKEYIDNPLLPQETAEALTSIGLETGSVETVDAIKGGLKGLVVGEVLTCEPHPNSDHLHITTVNMGNGEPQQIVCGAANVAAGQKVIVATIGTVLYAGDEEFKIKKSKIRGVESYGMICAEDEIGIGQSHEGIIVLPADAQPGTPAATYYGIEQDHVLEVDITPNRADACSHYGVARDLHAYLAQRGQDCPLKKPAVNLPKAQTEAPHITVQVDDKEGCLHYAGITIRGVKVSESPDYLKKRLASIGLHPINNVVDVTNYILHAFGQPLHCFDADKITGGQVNIGTLPEGTPFVTLDGVERKLHREDLMICAGTTPLCIAGVFGGKESGATAETTNIFLESALFHPTRIRKTARRHGLNTDASFRFERGIDPQSVRYCLEVAAQMICEIAGGSIAGPIVEVQTCECPAFRVELSFERIKNLVGKEIPTQEIIRILRALEINITAQSADSLVVEIPPYRVDVQRECDVVEEILRIYGYNNIEDPKTIRIAAAVPGEADRSNKLQNIISEQLVGGGFREIMNNSLTAAGYYLPQGIYPADKLVHLMNPLSNDLNVMRSTLLYGGLETLAHNINRKQADLQCFEFGNCYRRNQQEVKAENPTANFTEQHHLALWLTGNRVSGSWLHPNEAHNVYEVKAHVYRILQRLGLNIGLVTHADTQNELFVQGMEMTLRNGEVLARFGQLHPALLKQFDISQPVFYAEINWSLAMKQTKQQHISFSEPAKYPAVKRDLALLVDNEVKFVEIERIAYETGKKLMKKVSLFDVYAGKNIESGKKSYAVSFILQDETQTLTEKIVDKVMTNLVRNLKEELGAELR